MQDAEEGTLNEGGAELDGQVGADGRMVGNAPQPQPGGDSTDWILPVVVILLAVVVSFAAIRLVFMPGDRIPRIGGGPGSNV